MDLEKEIVLNPLVGIKIDDININFGINYEELINIFGEGHGIENFPFALYCPFNVEDELYYDNIDVHFCFDDHHILKYIEFGNNCLMVCNVSIYGHNLFEIPVRDLYDILSEHCENINEEVTGISHYFFQDIGMKFGIDYIGENPDWTEEECDTQDEYDFYGVTYIGIGTKDIME